MFPGKMHIPQSISEIRDALSSMLLAAPKFLDRTGYMPFKDINYAFNKLYKGLEANRPDLGDERYLELTQLSDQMRALFEADPDDKTGETAKGCKIIHEMDGILAAMSNNK